jgi:hypothetical protein
MNDKSQLHQAMTDNGMCDKRDKGECETGPHPDVRGLPCQHRIDEISRYSANPQNRDTSPEISKLQTI